MDIKVGTPRQVVRKPKARPQVTQEAKEEISPTLDGFTRGANAGTYAVLGGGGIMAGMATVGGLVYSATGSEFLAIPIGLVGGGIAGFLAGTAASAGLDAVGSKLDSKNPSRGALLAKTAAIGLTTALLSGGGDALQTLAVVGAFGAAGAVLSPKGS